MGPDASHDDGRTAGELTPAAVIVPEVRDAHPRRLLFTRRARDLDTHPGQMSFPGGRTEAQDASPRATALRETAEEIGIDAATIDVVGRLEPITTVTGFHVEAFVARIPDGPFSAERAEVAEVVTLPVEAFLAGGSHERERRTHPERGEVTVHYFHVDGYTVWGATAALLVQYLERTTGWSPPG